MKQWSVNCGRAGSRRFLAHGAVDAVDREEGQGIRADELTHAFEVVGGGQQLILLGRVDAVIVRMGDRRRGDAEMHLAGAGVAHHLHDLHRRGAAHDGVVDQHDALAGDHGAVGAVLQPHAELADLLGRLDEGAPDIVVADDAELVGNARRLGVTDRCRHAGIRHRNDHVGRRRRFAGEFGAGSFAHVIDAAAADDRIRPGEIDVFEDARPRRHRRKRLVRMRAVFVEDQDFAILDIADILRADDVERASFGGEDRTAVELAEHQRPNAERVARADQLLVGEADEGVGAFEHAQALDQAIDKAVAVRARHQMKDHLGVGGRLHHGAFADQLAPQRQAVGEIAVVADGEAAGIELGEERLHVAQDGFAGGRIADMTDGGGAGQAVDDFAAGKRVADQPETALGVKALAVERHDAGGFLAAMLQGVQSERGNGGGIRMTEYAEHPALFAQPVVVDIEGLGFGHEIGPPTRRARRAGPAAELPEYRYPPASGASTSSRWCFPGHPATGP